MNDVADLMMRFRTDGEDNAIRALNQVDNKITQVDHSARSAGGGLKGMLSTAGGFVIGGAVNAVASNIFNIGKGLLFANASAETAKMSLETVMGSADAANAKFKEIQQFAASTPFSFPELVQSTINLESFGLKSEDWMGTIGDTAAGMSKSVDQVTQAVLDAQGGQYERLTELGIRAQVEGDKVKFFYNKNGQDMVAEADKNSQSMINSTISGIWNDKYEGAMVKQSKTFTGQWSTLKDNINMSLMSMTGGIFEFAKSGIGILNSVFTQGFFDTFDGILGPSVTNFLKNLTDIGTGIVDAFGSGQRVSEIMANLPASWQPAANAIGEVADSLGDLYRAFQTGGAGKFFSVLQGELQTMGRAGIDLGEIVVRATFKLATSVDWAQIGRDVVDGLRGIDWASFIGPDSFNVGVTVGAAIRENVVRFIRGLTWDNVVQALKAGLIGALAIPGAFVGLAAQTASVIAGVFAGLVFGDDVNFSNVGDKISAAISSHMTLENFTAIGAFAINGIATGAAEAWQAISDWFGSRDQAAINAVGDLSSTLLSEGGALIDGLWDGALTQWDAFTGWLGGIGGTISDWVGDLSGVLFQAGADAIQGLIDGAWSMMPSLNDVVNKGIGIFHLFKDQGNSPWPMTIEAGGDAMDGLIVGANSRMNQLSSTVANAIGIIGFRAKPTVAFSAASVRTPAVSALTGGGGGHFYIDMRGAFVGKGARAEIESMISESTNKTVNRGVSRGRLESSY